MRTFIKPLICQAFVRYACVIISKIVFLPEIKSKPRTSSHNRKHFKQKIRNTNTTIDIPELVLYKIFWTLSKHKNILWLAKISLSTYSLQFYEKMFHCFTCLSQNWAFFTKHQKQNGHLRLKDTVIISELLWVSIYIFKRAKCEPIIVNLLQ